jgi:hypothetical protein
MAIFSAVLLPIINAPVSPVPPASVVLLIYNGPTNVSDQVLSPRQKLAVEPPAFEIPVAVAAFPVQLPEEPLTLPVKSPLNPPVAVISPEVEIVTKLE